MQNLKPEYSKFFIKKAGNCFNRLKKFQYGSNAFRILEQLFNRAFKLYDKKQQRILCRKAKIHII